MDLSRILYILGVASSDAPKQCRMRSVNASVLYHSTIAEIDNGDDATADPTHDIFFVASYRLSAS